MKRITISLGDDLYRIAKALAQSEDISLSRAVVRMMKRGLEAGGPATAKEEPLPYQYRDPRTGLLVTKLGRTITMEEIQKLIDDEDHRHLELLKGDQQ